jgi:hypothetical protein
MVSGAIDRLSDPNTGFFLFLFFISLSFAGVILEIKCCHHCVTLLKLPSFHLHRLLYVLYCILPY